MEKSKKEDLEEILKCDVRNCQKEVKKKDVMVLDGYTFCRECGRAYLNTKSTYKKWIQND